MASDISGIDDFIAQLALTRRARLRHMADEASRCGRGFAHPRRPAEIGALSPAIDTCACLRASGHDHGCLCAHAIERVVYRVDDDGREHYATLPIK